MAGARTFACIRSVIATARKQGWNILQILAANPADLIQALAA
jgi:transposase